MAGLRILHLSDSHFKAFWSSDYDRIVRQINDAEVDLICFTGDFVNKSDVRRNAPAAERFFTQLRSRLGIFACLGNHDGDWLRTRAAQLNVTFLEHARLLLRSDAATIELIGLVGVSREDLDPAFVQSIPPKSPDAVRIVLCHYPDLLPVVKNSFDFDLYLTGHTHGGQICLPGGVPVVKHAALPRRLCAGVHRINESWLVVNRGIGFTGIPLRLFCQAEMLEIVLRENQTSDGLR